jgi:hypothetical protein
MPMNELHQIECRNGPMPEDERWSLRLGSRAAVERSRARAAIRQISRACMNAFDSATFRTLYENQKGWRSYLRSLS